MAGTAGGNGRYNILVGIDGSEDSYRGLRYAVRFSADHDDTDITLLYIRPIERGTAATGLQLARENMLDWGIQPPGLRSLKRARDILLKMGVLGEDWDEKDIRKRARGSRLDDFLIDYIAPSGKHITLMLRVSSSVLNGILDECDLHAYDLVIMPESDEDEGGHVGHIDMDTSIAVAARHRGTVILAHELEDGHGHLVCLGEPETAAELVRKDATIAARCGCPIHLLAVAETAAGQAKAEQSLKAAEKVLEEMGYGAMSREVAVGDPVSVIIEKGRQYSLTVLSATEKSTLNRLLIGSVSRKLLEKAENSVMIVR